MSHLEIDPSWQIPKGPRSEFAFKLKGQVVTDLEQEAWILGEDTKKLVKNFGSLGSEMLASEGVKSYVLARPMSNISEEIHFMEDRFDPRQTRRSEVAKASLSHGFNVLILPDGIDFILEWANKLHIDVETMYARFMNMGMHVLKEERVNNRSLYEQERYEGGSIRITPYKFNWRK